MKRQKRYAPGFDLLKLVNKGVAKNARVGITHSFGSAPQTAAQAFVEANRDGLCFAIHNVCAFDIR
jgi:hypothetical protein